VKIFKRLKALDSAYLNWHFKKALLALAEIRPS